MAAVRCSLIAGCVQPACAKPFGRAARWLLRMQCGAVFDSNALEPPVSVGCRRSETCSQAAPPPPRKQRPPLEW